MITREDVQSIGVLRRSYNKPLPPFVFAEREGLLVPFRSDDPELIGSEVWVLKSDIQAPSIEEMTWQDLVGYTIEDEGTNGERTKIGVIEHIDDSTLNTLATLEDGRMLPLHEDFIIDINLDTRELRVNLPFSL